MRIIPAIDLIHGRCVRLYQGDYKKATQVADDPEAQLQRFIDSGAEMVHIVDLDGARTGLPEQLPLIAALCSQSSIPIEVGGGIRNLQTLERYLEAGVSRVVLGTAAIEDKAFLQTALTQYGAAVAVGVDAKEGKVATRGWEKVTETDYLLFSKELEAMGAQTIIFTDIAKDGTMAGPNLEAFQRLKTEVQCRIVASGGIRHMDDIQALSDIGIEEAIVGKAIYEGRIVLRGSRR